MQTVESIIASIYGRPIKAAEKLRVTPAAVANWKAAGYFPSRVLVPLCQHAREAGIALDVTEIPLMESARGEA